MNFEYYIDIKLNSEVIFWICAIYAGVVWLSELDVFDISTLFRNISIDKVMLQISIRAKGRRNKRDIGEVRRIL